MKILIPQKNYLIAVLLLIVSGSSFAQNNYFPTLPGLPASGYCGINTTSPMYSLDIYTDLAYRGASNGNVKPAGANNGSLHILNSRYDNSWPGFLILSQDIMSIWPQYIPSSGPAYTGANPFFMVDGYGNVGINTRPNYSGGFSSGGPYQFEVNGNSHITGYLTLGTGISTPAGYNLYVQNGILTEKLKIALHTDAVNWSDFVFNKDYKLMSLSNLEAYVKINKHLPEIPSTKDVTKDGIDVAAMDAKLLQKVEELTLYVIDQQKQLNNLQKQNKELQKKITALQK